MFRAHFAPRLPLAATALALLSLVACATPAPSGAQATAFAASAWPDACEDWDEWDKPGPPFRIHGNSYYVGTCGIGAILIAGEAEGGAGHILIDTGTEKGAQVVLANVARLGFDPADIRVLLMTHEHHDHVGGAAQLMAATGATLKANAVAAAAMLRGNVAADDPQAAIHPAMQPVPAAEVIAPGQPVVHGNNSVTMVPTPGHTSGAASWQWRSCEGADCRTIVYADSLSAVSGDDYRFTDHPEYVATFRKGIAALAALDCDILITPHPSASDMRKRIVAGSLVDGGACRAYAAKVGRALDERLATEAAK